MRSLFTRSQLTLSDRTDQAAGLRRLFSGGAHQRFVAVASNPHVACAGVLLERLTAAFAAQACHTLVIDASESAPVPAAAVLEDPALGLEPLGEGLSYLAARCLSQGLRDMSGGAALWLHRLAAAAPQCDVLLVHAPATELSRFFEGRALHPLVLAAEGADSLAHALASLRLLAARHRCAQFDVLLGVPMSSPQAARAVRHLGGWARGRLNLGLRHGVAVDPAREREEPVVPPLLARLAAALLEHDEQEPGNWHPDGDAGRGAAVPARN
jgi:flagellar biosynthesis protein FlhG